MYKIHRIFFGYESKQMPNALTPKRSGAAQFKKPCKQTPIAIPKITCPVDKKF